MASLSDRLLAQVQPQVGLAMARVGTVAEEAVVRQNRPHVAIELDLLRQRRVRLREARRARQQRRQNPVHENSRENPWPVTQML